MTRLVVGRDGFELDGEPLRILSGAMHYFRVHPEQWRPRLELLRGMGLNTVETYVAWNFHQPRRGEADFSGPADLERFLTVAADVGLYAIVRPGPYICAEWDNGGFPGWLLADRNLRLRCVDERYLFEVDRWFDELIPRVAGHQITTGGNVLMVQVENEYGSYGNDTAYLSYLADALRARGIDVPLFTSDGPTAYMLDGGTVEGAFATVNFGSRADDAFALQRRVRPNADDPLFCMEYWNGWFDHWSEHHHTRSAADAAENLDQILAAGASVNLYMAHGGTNFGLWAGANADEGLQPTVTSYDYDAAIDERGAPTEKYWAFRDVLGKYTELPPAPDPTPPPTLDATTVSLTENLRLLAALPSTTVNAAAPPTLEDLDQQHGLVLYRTRLVGPREAMPLTLRGLADNATVFVDGHPVATLGHAADGATAVELEEIGPEGVTIDILVEALGRANYGPRLGERKGIDGGVLHGRQFVFGWEAVSIPLDDVARLPWGIRRATEPAVGPLYRRGHFEVDEPRDAFLALPGTDGTWHRGVVWVNGFCLGRYDEAGPQRTLYLPGPVVRAGTNDLVVLELAPDATPGTGDSPAEVHIRTEPDLGPTT